MLYYHGKTMQKLTEKIWRLKVPQGIFNRQVIKNMYPTLSDGAIKRLINRAIACGEIQRITRSVYCLHSDFTESSPHPYLVANFLEFPSFISMETALHFHQLIPEAVYQVSSVYSGRNKIIKTPLGSFYYYSVPGKFPLAGVKIEKMSDQFWIMMATPLRALADILYKRKSVQWKSDGIGFLIDSLRIEEEDVIRLDLSLAEEIIANIRDKRTQDYIDQLREYIHHV
jgi:predicted transcriptional regulator of viral defense system